MIDTFNNYLKGTNLSGNTQESYLFSVKQYYKRYEDRLTKKNLRDYKMWLIENFSPKTVNLRLRGINCLLESIGKEQWKLNFVKVQQKPFLENVISEADYKYFKKMLKKDGEMSWYFVIRCKSRIFRPICKRWKTPANIHTKIITKRSPFLAGR